MGLLDVSIPAAKLIPTILVQPMLALSYQKLNITTCTPICGDYIVVSPETCDDGNTANGEGCSSTCTIETGYNCPQGHDCFVKCGNGIITSPEECDDGNESNGDGCSSTCKFEKGWSHTGVSPSFVFANTCFDSVLDANEDCDFGSGDQSCNGCDSHCGAAKGWTCTAGVCTSKTCGNNIVDSGEECDDGNLVKGDGCDCSCLKETGWNCNK